MIIQRLVLGILEEQLSCRNVSTVRFPRWWLWMAMAEQTIITWCDTANETAEAFGENKTYTRQKKRRMHKRPTELAANFGHWRGCSLMSEVVWRIRRISDRTFLEKRHVATQNQKALIWFAEEGNGETAESVNWPPDLTHHCQLLQPENQVA